jgi:hypothetical protein
MQPARKSKRMTVAIATAAALLALTAAPAGALVDRNGAQVPDTGPPQDQLAAGPQVVQVLAAPDTPIDDDPAALSALGSPDDPEADLVAALDDLAGAPDADSARSARSRALAILEGDPIPGAAYSGIPLLNYNSPAKVATVPAGGNVTVREIRFGEHAISDTWALRFEDPTKPFTITYRIAELGYTGIGGLLTPTPLLEQDGTPIGGLNSILQPLNVPLLPTGTFDSSRFHAHAAEVSRLALQDVTVRMPPPNDIAVILDPNLRPDRMTLATLLPATPQRLAAARDVFGSPDTDAGKVAAIQKIGDAAPEKQIWVDLRNLDPAATSFVADAHAVGRDDRELAFAMQTRSAPPSGVPDMTTAQIRMVLLNGETYVWTDGRPFAQGSKLTIGVTNADNYARSLSALDLHHSTPVGSTGIDFGQFAWAPLDLGQDPTLASGQTKTFTVTPAPATFALAVGDMDHGDQGMTLCRIDAASGAITCPSDGIGAVRPPARPIHQLGEGTRNGPPGPSPGPLGPGLRAACAQRAWVGIIAGRRRVLLLGFTRAQLTACVGEPVRRTARGPAETWTYRGGLTVRLRRGYVYGFALTGNALRSQRGRVGVGSRASAIAGALRSRVVFDRRAGAYRAVIHQSPTVYADLRIRRTRRAPRRITRIAAAMRSFRQLDPTARRLAAARG